MNSKLRSEYPAVWKQQCLLAFLSCLCYVNSIWGQFVFDDNEALLNNKDLDLNTSWTQVFHNDFWGTDILSNSSHKSYRPLTIMSFRLNAWLAGGLKPMGFHLVNICLHITVSLLYFKICSIICNLSSERKIFSVVPSIAALIFAVHPIHTESVAGIVGRAELMSAIFFFLSIQFYMRASEENITLFSMCSWLILSIIMVIISLLFKEQGITAMGICIIFDVTIRLQIDPLDLLCLKCSRKEVRWSRFFVRVGITLGAMGIIVALRLSTGSPTFKPVDNPASFAESTLTRVLSYNYIYAVNIWLLINPWWLCFDWSMDCIPLLDSLLDARFITVLLFWIALCLLVMFCVLGKASPFKRIVLMSLGILVVTFLPASNLFIRVGFVVAERVLYLPSAGYCLLIGLGLSRVIQFSNKFAWTCVTLLISLFVIRSIQRSSEWCKEENLFVSGLKVCPNNAKVYYNVGKVKSDGGNTATGMIAYREAIRLYPEYDQALNNLGNLLKGIGNHTEAEQLFHRAIDANPTFAAAWMNLGIVQAAQTKWRDAEESYLTAIKHRRKYPDAYYNLGNLFIDSERHQNAIEAYEAAISLKRDHLSAWTNMGLLYEKLSMYDKAEEVMRQGIIAIPDGAQLHSSLGVLLGKQSRLEEGKVLLETAVKLSPMTANYHANLGVLYHLMKDYKRAEDSYSMALKLKPDLKLAKENYNKLLSSTKSR